VNRDPLSEHAFRGLLDIEFATGGYLPEEDIFSEGQQQTVLFLPGYTFVVNDPLNKEDLLGLINWKLWKRVGKEIRRGITIGGYEPGSIVRQHYCLDNIGNGLPCPSDINDPAFDDLKEYCEANCEVKHCKVTRYNGVYRPNVGTYDHYKWTVGCSEECGDPDWLSPDETGEY